MDRRRDADGRGSPAKKKLKVEGAGAELVSAEVAAAAATEECAELRRELRALRAAHASELQRKDSAIAMVVEEKLAASQTHQTLQAAAALQLAERDAAILTLVPAPPTGVCARNRFAGSVTVWWTPSSRRRGVAATELIVCAIDTATGALVDDLERVASSATGAHLVDAVRLASGRTLRFFVRAPLVGTALPEASFRHSGLSDALTIGAALEAEAPINATPLLRRDSVALALYASDPRGASWTAQQHGGVRRAVHTRGLGLLQIPRLARLERVAALRAVRRAACALDNAMRLVLHFALPHCTPTKSESREMMKSCHDGHVATATKCLRAGIDPNTVDTSGYTDPKNRGAPLVAIAARNKDAAVVGALIAAGCDVNKAKPNGVNALAIASWNGHTSVAAKLLLAGARVDATSANGSALHIAALRGHRAVVALLVSSGARKNEKSSQGWTPLWCAAREGHAKSCALLLAAAVDVEVRCDEGTTALFQAASNNHCAVLQGLIAAGADVDAMSAEGVTPLIMAVSREHGAAVKLLLCAGANRELQWNAETALDYANNAGLEAMAELLRA